MGTVPSTKGPRSTRRPYRSPLRERRAAETRAAVIDAARRLFLSEGWAATGMREVATAAGVSTETVYAYFSSKRGLLQAVLDVAVVDDDQPVALAGRPEFGALGEGPRADRIRATARLLATIQERTARLAKVLFEAAAADEEIAEMLRVTREQQRLTVAMAMELIMGRAPTPVERDGWWAIVSPEVYLLLVEESGWTLEEYEGWMAELFERAAPRS